MDWTRMEILKAVTELTGKAINDKTRMYALKKAQNQSPQDWNLIETDLTWTVYFRNSKNAQNT